MVNVVLGLAGIGDVGGGPERRREIDALFGRAADLLMASRAAEADGDELAIAHAGHLRRQAALAMLSADTLGRG